MTRHVKSKRYVINNVKKLNVSRMGATAAVFYRYHRIIFTILNIYEHIVRLCLNGV